MKIDLKDIPYQVIYEVFVLPTIEGRRVNILREWDNLRSKYEVKLPKEQEASHVKGEPVGWYTEDHLDDKSATTYSAEIAQRWRDKGWPVWPLYTDPQITEQKPNSHVWDDQDKCHLCGVVNWYPSAKCTPKQQPAPDESEPKAKTPKESWWAGYRAGKGLPANTPRQDAIAAPDVYTLVEALTALRGCITETRGPDARAALLLADAALATFYKGEEV